MSQDIFISYSSKDRAQAEQLIELLASAGLSVWIDRSGIDVAMSWSGEIVQAINDCKAFIVLLSSNSIASHNVIKEVSLASEKRKKILPLDLEPVQLTKDFEYQLAGIQRAPMTNIDSIIRAIGKLGLEATSAPSITIVKETDSRKSLMILPFEDLSPTADNGWFADGIVNELITSLSKIKSLRVKDQRSTKEFKDFKGHLAWYAKEMSIRYFLEGDVRKFGDQIKISCSLLDIETGDHLWQDSHKGTMADVFDMQEEVAMKVVEGLKVHLLASESAKLAARPTENAEAYEMYLKAEQYFARQGNENAEYALISIGRSLELDPNFSLAMLRRAIILIGNYLNYNPRPEFMEEAGQLLERARLTVSVEDDWRILGTEAMLLEAKGEIDHALELLLENIRIMPTDPIRHRVLAFFFMRQNRSADAIQPLEIAISLIPGDYPDAKGLLTIAWEMKRNDLRDEYARRFLPLFEQRTRMAPDDEDMRVVYGMCLGYIGREEEAHQHLLSIADSHLRNTGVFRNAACLAAAVGEPDRAMAWLKRLAPEFRPEFVEWLDDPELDPIREREDFIALRADFEERARTF